MPLDRDKVGAVLTFGSAVALCLIVCRHLPSHPANALLDLGVPWFFFASGYWYSQSAKSYGEQVRTRVRTLLVPYFLWNALWFPIVFAANWIGWRYCGVERVVDGSLPCVVRCLGLSPFAWPALVPTWFLRALFAVVVVIGGLDRLTGGRRMAVCLLCWLACWVEWTWGSAESPLRGFFSFGLPLLGGACFATGLVVGDLLPATEGVVRGRWVGLLRRQLMPVYLLHAIVIMVLGWGAKTFHRQDLLTTATGEIVLWFAGVGGAIALGECLRRRLPRAACLLLGGR